MFRPVLVIPPASLPVTVEQVRAHLRIDHTEEDAYLASLIGAAVDHLDGWSGILGRALITQTWRQDFTGFDCVMRLPMFPVASIASVAYVDASGATVTLNSDVYELQSDERGAFIRLKVGQAWPVTGESNAPASVAYVCGSAAADVPAAIRHAILIMVADMYRFTETSILGNATQVQISTTVDRLLWPHRRVHV